MRISNKKIRTKDRGAVDNRAPSRGRDAPNKAKNSAKKSARELSDLHITDAIAGHEDNTPESRAARMYAHAAEDGGRVVTGKTVSGLRFTVRQARKLYARRKSRKMERDAKAAIQERLDTHDDLQPAKPLRGKSILSKAKRTARFAKGAISAPLHVAGTAQRVADGNNGESASSEAAEGFSRAGRMLIRGSAGATIRTGRFALRNGRKLRARNISRREQAKKAQGPPNMDTRMPDSPPSAEPTDTGRAIRDRSIKTREALQNGAYRNTLTREKAVYRAQASAVMEQKSGKFHRDNAARQGYAESKKAHIIAEKQRFGKKAHTSGADALPDGPIKKKKLTIGREGRTIRQSQRQIRSVRQYTHTTTQAMKKARKSRQIMRHAIRISAKKTQFALKKAAEAAKILLQMIIRAARMVLAAIAAAGPFFIVILLLLVLIVAVMASPFGIFFSPNEQAHPHISQIVREIEGEFEQRELAMAVGYAAEDVVHDWESDGGMGGRWLEIVPVFAVKTTTDASNGMDVVTLDDQRQRMLREVFWDMVRLESHTRSVPVENEVVQEDGSTVIETSYKTELVLTLTNKSALEQASEYGFDEKQLNMLKEALEPEYQAMLMQLLGIDSALGLTPEEMLNLYNNLPVGEIGAEIVKFALSRLGDPYSKRDCSSFTRWVYSTVAGVDIPSNAAAQAKWCVEKGLTVSYDNLQPGDLIFWWWNRSKKNGRFMNIDHVGIVRPERAL